MTEAETKLAYALWQAQAANAIGRDNAEKRAKRAGMESAAQHIACALYPSSALGAERIEFMRACGFR